MKVVFIVADSLRADAPGFAGGPAETPLIDRLATEGTRFDRAFVTGAWTIPSLMSMLTGSYPHRISIARWRHTFPAHRPTLLTAFRDAGFDVRCLHPYPQWGFINTPGKGEVGNSQDPQAVIEALGGPSDSDRFVLIHHWWTHLPYVNSELSLEQWHAACDFALESVGKYPERIAPKLEQSFHKSVSFLSEQLLGRYLDAATAGGGDVLLVLTGDHGETWGRSLPQGRRVENVYDLHGRWISDETIHVPLVFWGKGAGGAIPSDQALGGFARGVDIGATIADLAGIPWPGPIPEGTSPMTCDRGLGADGEGLEIVGRSLRGCIERGEPAPHDEVVTFSSENCHVPRTYPDDGKLMWRTLGLRDDTHWYVWDGVDGEGSVSGIGEGAGEVDGERVSAVHARLEELRQGAADPGPLIAEEHLAGLRAGEDEDNAAVVERLRTLGYLE
ncbi:MAG: sulfatase-like hydrolase/transferase [Deltaproteobacteria bacterium]|nr:sulfatase-like hydrolase/transferase [Deltaproteobacteria bacterium]